MLDKKQIRAIFLLEVKMGRKAAETTRNINNALSPGTANKCTVQQWFKKFCKGDESLEDEEYSGQPSKVDNDNWQSLSKLILLQLHEKLPKNSVSTILWFVSHLKQTGKVKKLGKWVPRGLTANQKNHHFEVSSSLILHNNNEQFVHQILTCNKKWILYNNWQGSAQWLDQEFPKPFPKPNLRHCLMVWADLMCYSFWIPVKTLHLKSTLSKLMRCTESCNACSWHWSTEKAQFFFMTTLNCMMHN